MDWKKNKKIIFTVVSVTLFATVCSFRAEAAVKVNSLVAAPLPTRIIIPKAKVNASVISIGITKEGNLDVPNNYTEAGWYKYGTLPGKIGSAVIDGHVDNGNRVPGPFKNLKLVKPGDNIYVTMGDGKMLHYSIVAAEIYDTDKFPGEYVFHESGQAYLKIITCHGKFIRSKQTYDQRLIVKAVLVPQKNISV